MQAFELNGYGTLADTRVPYVSSLNPADDSTGVAVDADFVITFDEK